MDNILEVSGINKSYDDFSLKDISFYLPEGCITGFVGINGAGKTTTLRSILGLTNNVSGKINFFGMDIKGNESEIKDRIGIVLDDGCFYDELTISEMKSIIAPAYKNWCEQDFIDYLERFELNPKEHQYPKAATLLCATPYPRRLIVLSKYLFCLVIYAVCCLIFGIDTLLFPKLGTFDIRMAVIIFFTVTVFLSVYFPALYKLGYEKTKFFFVLVIMASPILFAALFKPENKMKFDFLNTVSTTMLIIFGIVISLIIFSISAILSIKFFEKSDLA